MHHAVAAARGRREQNRVAATPCIQQQQSWWGAATSYVYKGLQNYIRRTDGRREPRISRDDLLYIIKDFRTIREYVGLLILNKLCLPRFESKRAFFHMCATYVRCQRTEKGRRQACFHGVLSCWKRNGSNRSMGAHDMFLKKPYRCKQFLKRETQNSTIAFVVYNQKKLILPFLRNKKLFFWEILRMLNWASLSNR